MSFKDELEKILAEFGRKCSPVATLRNVDNPLVRREHIESATTSIINLVDKELPTSKLTMSDAMWDFPDGMEGQMQRAKLVENEGYNQAIDDMRAKLKEDK